MTTILYANNMIVADSAMYNHGVRFESLNKIRGFEYPTRIVVEEDREDDPIKIDDIVYGWTSTGSVEAATAFTNTIANLGQFKPDDEIRQMLKVHFAMYRTAFLHQLAIPGYNTFDVFLIGKKANHSIRWDHAGLVYTKFPKDKIVAMGSGCDLALQNFKIHQDTVRAVVEACHIDATSGGHLDIWELLPVPVKGRVRKGAEPNYTFRRTGFFSARTPSEVAYLLQQIDWTKDQKLPVDLVTGDELKKAQDPKVMGEVILKLTRENPAWLGKLKSAVADAKKRDMSRRKAPPVAAPVKATRKAAAKKVVTRTRKEAKRTTA